MLKLIVIDDEENVRFVVESLVKKSQLDIRIVYQASDGDEGLEKSAQLKPDIIVTDIRMPGIDGLEMLRRIKLISPTVEVIVISGYSDFAYAQKALHHGALGYLLKPIDDDEFFGVLNKAKDRIEKRQHDQAEIDNLERTIRKLQNDIVNNELLAQEDISTCASMQLKKALAYIHENYSRDISLEQTASQVFLSPTYLSELCKKHLDRSFVDYLNNLRVQKAQQLLEKTELHIYEIACLVGFNEVSYFIRVFRKYAGMSPTEYRKSSSGVQ